MKILERRDISFDICRAFLVLCMVVMHSILMYCKYGLSSNYTLAITLGFAFISGFAIGALYTNRLKNDFSKYSRRLMFRGAKLILIFTILNLIILYLHDIKYSMVVEYDLWDIIVVIFLGSRQDLFGFDILVPIALTSIMSWLFIIGTKGYATLLIIILLIFSVVLLDLFVDFNVFGLKALMVGLIGVELGKIATTVDWDEFINWVVKSRFKYLCYAVIALYYYLMTVVAFNDIYVSIHILPTIFLLFVVYLLARDIYSVNIFRPFYTHISENLLLAYVSHILILRMLTFIIQPDSFNLYLTVFLAATMVMVTYYITLIADNLSSNYPLFKRLYRSFFKL